MHCILFGCLSVVVNGARICLVRDIYAARGFEVKYMLMDGEFVPMKHDLASAGIVLNTTTANEHVPRIERQIRVIKERVRATRHTLPFKVIPLTMLIGMIYTSVLWINAFPPKGGVSPNLSPRNITTGVQFDYNLHCKLHFACNYRSSVGNVRLRTDVILTIQIHQ